VWTHPIATKPPVRFRTVGVGVLAMCQVIGVSRGGRARTVQRARGDARGSAADIAPDIAGRRRGGPASLHDRALRVRLAGLPRRRRRVVPRRRSRRAVEPLEISEEGTAGAGAQAVNQPDLSWRARPALRFSMGATPAAG